MVAVEDISESGGWKKEIKFAVPRMMEWSPNEYSELCEHKMSFSDFHTFDFGKTFVETTGNFELHKYQRQRGKLDLSCKGEHRRKYIFRITVDNYVIPNQYAFEVRSSSYIPNDKWIHKWQTVVDPV